MAPASSIVLVGASGHVGRLVAAHWLGKANDMPLLLQYRQGGSPHPHLIWDPMCGPEALVSALGKNQDLSCLVMLAGSTIGSIETLEQNRKLAEACLDAADQAGISRVLIASSSAVYGISKGSPYLETDQCYPANDYGRSKLDMELACASWRNRGLEVCCMRIGNVAGADALLRNAVLLDADTPLDIDLFSDGHGPVRSYIGVRTLAEVLQTLCKYSGRLPQVLNVGATRPVAMDALAEAAGKAWRPRAAKPSMVQHITLDCSLLASLHKFLPSDSDPTDMVLQWKEVTC